VRRPAAELAALIARSVTQETFTIRFALASFGANGNDGRPFGDLPRRLSTGASRSAGDQEPPDGAVTAPIRLN
jgi:hypothetical protein